MNIQEEMNTARKAKDAPKLLVLQDLSTRVLLESKRLKRELTAIEMHNLLTKMANIRVEARDAFRAVGKIENATNEQVELELIRTFDSEYAALVPKAMTPNEIKLKLIEIKMCMPNAKIGDMMKAFRAQYPGQDGEVVKLIVGALLNPSGKAGSSKGVPECYGILDDGSPYIDQVVRHLTEYGTRIK